MMLTMHPCSRCRDHNETERQKTDSSLPRKTRESKSRKSNCAASADIIQYLTNSQIFLRNSKHMYVSTSSNSLLQAQDSDENVSSPNY
eukprot:scaffold2_cov94-Skeletonema_dohrnii-CCMP3373.AAC.6